MLGHYLTLSRSEAHAAAIVPFASTAGKLADAVAALPGTTHLDAEMAGTKSAPLAQGQRWLAAYGRFWVTWEAWQRRDTRAPAANRTDDATPEVAPPLCLSRDQSAAIEHLVGLARARERADVLGGLPVGLRPRRWPHPFLVGPAGSGKAFVVEETARRLRRAVLRVEIASWIVVANRSGRASLEKIADFLATHPDGVIYLSGVDTLAGNRLGQSGNSNLSWWASVLGEIESFLDWAAATKAPLPAVGESKRLRRPFVVVGGRFSSLWGQSDLGGPAGAEAWRLADARPLADPELVVDWLEREGWLPAGVRSRLAARPLVINPVSQEEAWDLSRQMCAALPAGLDGLIELQAAAETLAGPGSWRDLAAMIEVKMTISRTVS